MKKIDKLIIQAFFGPFFLTLAIVIFIFLMRLLMFYMNEFVGKDIEFLNYVRLLTFFSLNTIPIAMPLAILLSTLMTFGALGEFFELTAIKSAGISVTRAMLPLFFVTIGLCGFTYWYNNEIYPWANLKGYSLLYDIKTAKATLNIKEGIFYNDLPGYNIKVDKKFPDGRTLKNLVIYKHPPNSYDTGNTEVILADSGKMYTINNQGYLVFELFKGNMFSENVQTGNSQYIASSTSSNDPINSKFSRNHFDTYKLVVSLDAFGLKRTNEQQFEYHEWMKDRQELINTADSLNKEYATSRQNLVNTSRQYFSYNLKEQTVPLTKLKAGKWIDSLTNARLKTKKVKIETLSVALQSAKSIEASARSNVTYINEKKLNPRKYELELQHKLTQVVACFMMFLIGAPLGAIIKKGGFGMPVLVSIVFFILMYVFTMQGDKWAKEGITPVWVGAWFSNFMLGCFGLYFMDRARNDSNLFDADFYKILLDRIKQKWRKNTTFAA